MAKNTKMDKPTFRSYMDEAASEINPLIGINACDTVNQCRCALAWLANVNDEPAGGNDEWRFGHQMLLETIVAGLAFAENQLKNEAKPALVVVNG